MENIKSFFLQEMFEAGVLVLSTHNVSLGIKKKDISKVLVAYELVLTKLKDSLLTGTLSSRLKCEPVKNLFTIR